MTTILDAPGSNPPNTFTARIQALLDDRISAPEIAATIVADVFASPDPANALWQFWDAFFSAATTAAAPGEPPAREHHHLLTLLDTLRTQPPTRFNHSLSADAARALCSYADANGQLDWATLPRFGAQWRDVHDALLAWHDWDGVRASGGGSGDAPDHCPPPEPAGAKYLRFCAFSAAVVGRRHYGDAGVSPIWVFFACCNALEQTWTAPGTERRPNRLSPEQLWALAVRVTATWLRSGGRVLFETSEEDLGRHWAPALKQKTDLWPREDGLTQDRWRLWIERLRAASTEEQFDEETRTAAKDAAELTEGFLRDAGVSSTV